MKKVIWYLIISDILILSSFNLIVPIFAIFLKEGISGGSITAAGIASAIFLIVKSALQLPLSHYIDKKRNKISLLLLGTLIVVSVPFFYALSKNITYIYITQVIYGIGASMAYPAWFSLFSMHLDKKHRGFEWSLWSSGVNLGMALTAYMGAVIAVKYNFKTLFYITGIISFIGMIVLLFLSKKYLKDVKEVEEKFGKIFKLKHTKI